MGRGIRDTIRLSCRVNTKILEELKSLNPRLFTQVPGSTEIKFRYGSLGKYIERLIMDDIEARRGMKAANEQGASTSPEVYLDAFGLAEGDES